MVLYRTVQSDSSITLIKYETTDTFTIASLKVKHDKNSMRFSLTIQ
jgi:hypothetical protein